MTVPKSPYIFGVYCGSSLEFELKPHLETAAAMQAEAQVPGTGCPTPLWIQRTWITEMRLRKYRLLGQSPGIRRQLPYLCSLGMAIMGAKRIPLQTRFYLMTLSETPCHRSEEQDSLRSSGGVQFLP